MNIEEQLTIEYKKNMEHNYLVIKDTIYPYDNYQTRMLEENDINGLLKLCIRSMDTVYSYNYEISSLQPISRIYNHKEMDYSELLQFINKILNAYSSAEDYLLEESHYIIHENYIYMNIETKEIYLLFYPPFSQSVEESFLYLAEYILDKVNHSDSLAVLVAYQFYKVIKQGNFTISSLKAAITTNPKEPQKEEIIDNTIPEEPDENSEELFESKELVNNPQPNTEKKFSFFKLFNNKRSNTITCNKDETTELCNNTTADCIDASDTNDTFCLPDGSAYTNESYGRTVIFTDNAVQINEHTLTYSTHGKEIVYKLDNLPATIGKMKDAVDIVINDNTISRLHATIFKKDNQVYIKDCSSTNGTFINEMQLNNEEEIMLESGDDIRLGRIILKYM